MSKRFKVSSRVLDFTLLLLVGTGATVGAARFFGKTEEDKEAEIRRKFPDLVRQSEANKKNMQQFFDTLKKDPNDKDAQNKFDLLLRGGKGEVKNQSTNRLITVADGPPILAKKMEDRKVDSTLKKETK